MMDAVVLTCFDIIMLHDPHRSVSELLDSITETVAASKTSNLIQLGDPMCLFYVQTYLSFLPCKTKPFP